MSAPAPTGRPAPPEPPEPVDPDLSDPSGDDSGGGWWAQTPGWAKVVVAGSLALLLILLGGIGGILAGRATTPSYGPPPGSIDVGFLQDMTVHHRQAVEMAVWERGNTTDPALRQLAFDIESSQTAQVGRMEGWLALWGQPLSTTGQYMGWMGMPTSSMPGMASPDDLTRLRASSGQQLDVVFLQLMLRHHRGGLSMMETAQSEAGVPVVRQLATSMVASQSAEADTMTAMLAARGAAPLPG